MTDRWTEGQRRYFDGGLASYRELYARENPFPGVPYRAVAAAGGDSCRAALDHAVEERR